MFIFIWMFKFQIFELVFLFSLNAALFVTERAVCKITEIMIEMVSSTAVSQEQNCSKEDLNRAITQIIVHMVI